jgi:hypothetical protein
MNYQDICLEWKLPYRNPSKKQELLKIVWQGQKPANKANNFSGRLFMPLMFSF